MDGRQLIYTRNTADIIDGRDKNQLTCHVKPNCEIFKKNSIGRWRIYKINTYKQKYDHGIWISAAKHFVVLNFMVMYYFRKILDNLILILIILWNLYWYGTQILFECFCESRVEQKIIYSFCERCVFSFFLI